MTGFTFTFLRHAESVGNAQGYYQGQKDYPLSSHGENQVKLLISRWQADGTLFDQAITSPLTRALTTAEMICQKISCPLDVDADWSERDLGCLEGVKQEDAEKDFPKPEFYTPYDNMGQTGEGNWELYLRAGKAIHKILQRPPARYLIVSHGGILNQVMQVIFGIAPQANGQGVQFRFVNTAFAKMNYYPDSHKWVVLELNDYSHLAVNDFDFTG